MKKTILAVLILGATLVPTQAQAAPRLSFETCSAWYSNIYGKPGRLQIFQRFLFTALCY